jgi:hypothetical protein
MLSNFRETLHTIFAGEIYTIAEKTNTSRLLNKKESITVDTVCQSFQDNKDKIQILYRGESKITLEDKLKESYGSYKFFEHLFFVGEKAKFFFKETSSSIENREHLKSISDVDDATFKFIFKSLHYIFTSEDIVRESKQRELNQFKTNEFSFVQFFSDLTNVIKFLDAKKFEILNTEENLIRLRDYYLYLLHTYGMENASLFVSTSRKRKIAQKFSNKDKDNSIIFWYFIPKPIHYYGVSYLSFQESQAICEDCNLPTYDRCFYPQDDEVSIKGALFPHFILGIEDRLGKKFVVNPHIFKQTKKHIPLIPQKGLFINQENFSDKIINSGYTGYVNRWNDKGLYFNTFHR